MTQVMPLMTQFGGTTDRFLGPMKAATRDRGPLEAKPQVDVAGISQFEVRP